MPASSSGSVFRPAAPGEREFSLSGYWTRSLPIASGCSRSSFVFSSKPSLRCAAIAIWRSASRALELGLVDSLSHRFRYPKGVLQCIVRCRSRARSLLEVLGSVEHFSTDPRGNTSKTFFEALRSGDKADTCLHFVSSLSPLFVDFIGEVDTKRIQNKDEIAALRHRRPPVSYAGSPSSCSETRV